jgi:cytidine deaminase
MVKFDMAYYREQLIEMRKKQTLPGSELKFNHMCVIITKKGTPLSYGYNDYNFATQTSEHAEEMAIRKLLEKKNMLNIELSKKKLYLLVVRTNGYNSKPCSRCVALINKYAGLINLKDIFYSHEEEDDGIRKERFRDLLHGEQHMCSYSRFMHKGKKGQKANKENCNISSKK